MTIDVYSVVAGAILGSGFGMVIGFFLGMYAYGKANKDTFARLKAVLNLKK